MSKAKTWIDERFPATKMWKSTFPNITHRKFQLLVFFGSLALLVWSSRSSPAFLTMNYKPDAAWRLLRWNTSCAM